jgi:hypothetical protein
MDSVPAIDPVLLNMASASDTPSNQFISQDGSGDVDGNHHGSEPVHRFVSLSGVTSYNYHPDALAPPAGHATAATPIN